MGSTERISTVWKHVESMYYGGLWCIRGEITPCIMALVYYWENDMQKEERRSEAVEKTRNRDVVWKGIWTFHRSHISKLPANSHFRCRKCRTKRKNMLCLDLEPV